MSVTIAPIRGLIILMLLTIASTMAKVITHKQDIQNKPITGWRK
jgi:hypothetical protein